MPANVKVEGCIARWGYLYDNIEEEQGGGFATGEFALDHDGRLYRRSTGGGFLNGRTTWRANEWSLVKEWSEGADTVGLIAFLTGGGYDLYPPSPIPVNGLSAGPLEGPPEYAGKPLHAARFLPYRGKRPAGE